MQLLHRATIPTLRRDTRAYGGYLRHHAAKKDVAACDKPREGGKQPLIRGFPNGETPLSKPQRPITEYIGDVEHT